MSYTVLGIDPGVGGACVFLENRHKLVFHKNDCTEHDLSSFILDNASLSTFAFIEKVHSMPKQGVATTFKFGDNNGFLRGLIVALDIPYELITPQKWQAYFGLLRKNKKESETAKKNRHKARAQQLFPRLSITHKIADALLIAEFGRRVLKQRGDAA